MKTVNVIIYTTVSLDELTAIDGNAEDQRLLALLGWSDGLATRALKTIAAPCKDFDSFNIPLSASPFSLSLKQQNFSGTVLVKRFRYPDITPGDGGVDKTILVIANFNKRDPVAQQFKEAIKTYQENTIEDLNVDDGSAWESFLKVYNVTEEAPQLLINAMSVSFAVVDASVVPPDSDLALEINKYEIECKRHQSSV